MHVSGLRGTGSKDVIVDGIRAAHRLMPMMGMGHPQAPGSCTSAIAIACSA
jgi:hypothetical protein